MIVEKHIWLIETLRKIFYNFKKGNIPSSFQIRMQILFNKQTLYNLIKYAVYLDHPKTANDALYSIH